MLEALKVYVHDHRVKVWPKSILFVDGSALLPFDIEPQNFQYTNKLEDADIIIVHHVSSVEILAYLNYSLENKLILVTSHTHSHELEHEDSHAIAQQVETINQNFNTPWNVKYLTCCFPSDSFHKDTVFYEGYYNREKCYFVDYEKISLIGKLWSGLATKKMYDLSDIKEKIQQDTKKFLVPNKIISSIPPHSAHKDRLWYRQELSKHLTEEHCFFSDFQQTPPITLDSQEELPPEVPFGERFWWAPVHNRYHEKSVVSVFVETITYSSDATTVTEKCFDPLIKGSFILPFGYSGLIQDLKNHFDFKFPDWIDYSYDTIEDTDQRFEAFLSSFHKLQQLDLETLINYNNRDIELLRHNRNVFFHRPYDSLYHKLLPLVRPL